jgi:hypothetical protein
MVNAKAVDGRIVEKSWDSSTIKSELFLEKELKIDNPKIYVL